MGKINPITPEEAADLKRKEVPDEVIEAFNGLIVEDYDGHAAIVYRKEVVEAIQQSSHGIVDFEWADIEPLYSYYGWKVECCDTAATYFKFTKVIKNEN